MLLPKNVRAKSSKNSQPGHVASCQYADREGQPGDADNDESEALPIVVEHES